MREIKFRAWDKKRKTMNYTDDFLVRFNGDVVKECEVEFTHEIDILTVDDCILMQYIGLKDKNGKEIYEGDILEQYGSIGKVIYEDDRFYVDWDKEPGRVGLFEGCTRGRNKIIGNIYENPELLYT